MLSLRQFVMYRTWTGRRSGTTMLKWDAIRSMSERPTIYVGQNPRVILLGASNLTRSISTVVATASQIWGSPVDVVAAMGHGRSYGLPTQMFGRTLPGIMQCGLWDFVRRCPKAPTAALITDVGNDLLYEAPLDQIMEWMKRSLDQLLSYRSQVVMTLLPMSSIESLTTLRFQFFRRLLFPRSKIQLGTAIALAHRLNDSLRRLGETCGITLFEPRSHWYGVDPIHIKIRLWKEAWNEVLSTWKPNNQYPIAASGSILRWWYLRRLSPQRRWVRGVECCCQQPVGSFADGSTFSFF